MKLSPVTAELVEIFKEQLRRGELTKKKVRASLFWERDKLERFTRSEAGGRPPCKSGSSRRLLVDHCHKTGKVRGLLCSRCNFAIGLLADDPKILRRAIRYLQRRR